MRVAESLYMSGLLSYPRTESTAYPRGFDFTSLLAAHAAHPEWGVHARSLLDAGQPTAHSRPGAVDAGDHPPITPTTHVPSRAEVLANVRERSRAFRSGSVPRNGFLGGARCL